MSGEPLASASKEQADLVTTAITDLEDRLALVSVAMDMEQVPRRDGVSMAAFLQVCMRS